MKFHDSLPRLAANDQSVSIRCVTNGVGGCMHRFFDTSPFSPSGRYVASFRLPFEDRFPVPGDEGEVVVTDLHSGTETTVWRTKGWEPQMGCNLQWLGERDELIFNDVDTTTWTPHAVVLDPFSGASRRLAGGVYQASPDGTRAAACNLAAMRRTQRGYGVVVPDEHCPINGYLPDDDGLYLTDTATGTSRLLVSLRQAFVDTTPRHELEQFRDWRFYGFHTKWNPQGSRLIFTARWYHKDTPNPWDNIGRCRFNVFTLRPDGSDIRLAVPHTEWEKGGHHINWFPDGEHLSMNLRVDRAQMFLMRVRYDGSGYRKITSSLPGSGHPTVHPDGRHILTDTYVHELGGPQDGTVPLRWIDLKNESEETLVRIRTLSPHQATCGCLRIDPHPAWNRAWTHVAFNAYEGGTRRVYVADMSEKIRQGEP